MMCFSSMRMVSAPICASFSAKWRGRRSCTSLRDAPRRRVPRLGCAIGDASGIARRSPSSSVALQARQVPLLVDRVRRHEARDQVGDHVARGCRRRSPRTLLGFEQFVALLVDHLALVVVDVVEVEQVLADVEVVGLDLALRVVDLLGDQRAFDDVVFLQAHARHHASAPSRRRRCASGCLRATGRSARNPGRPGGRSGRAAGCRCGAIRGARCRRCAGRRRPSPRRGAAATRLHARALSASVASSPQRGCSSASERTAEHDVGTAAGHVGGDGDRARATGLGDDLRFALVLLGVEHFVRRRRLRAAARTSSSETSIEVVPTSTGWPRAWQSWMSSTTASELAGAVEEHQVGLVLAHHRAVGRDHDHFQAVDALEFVGFGVGRAGHAGQLVVHAEQVLEGDRWPASGSRAGPARLPSPRPPGAGRRTSDGPAACGR